MVPELAGRVQALVQDISALLEVLEGDYEAAAGHLQEAIAMYNKDLGRCNYYSAW